MSKRGEIEEHCLNIVKEHLKESVFLPYHQKNAEK
jgi:hypothetical protein